MLPNHLQPKRVPGWVFLAVGLTLVVVVLSVAVVKNQTAQRGVVNNEPQKANEEVPDNIFQPNTCDAVRGQLGMVSTTNEMATRAGIQILEAGGNAMDAAAAIQFALSVVQPQSTGIGGGLFFMTYDAETNKVYAMDGREEAPEKFHENIFCDTSSSGENCEEACTCESGSAWVFAERRTGGNSAGVPGCIAAIGRLIEDNGTLPMSQLVAPAVDLARNGFPMYQGLYNSISSSAATFRRFPASEELFLPVTPVGALFRNPDLANTLEMIGQDWTQFYEGQLAKDIVDAAQGARNGVTGLRGMMEMSDLEGYKAVYREPVSFLFNESLRIFGMSPPTAGGILTAQAVQLLSTKDISGMSGPLDVNYLHRLIDIQDIAWSDRSHWLGDADFVDIPTEGLVNAAYIFERAELMHDEISAGAPVHHGMPPGANVEYATADLQEGSGTTHFTVADRFGNMVSATTTVESSMGCGVVVPGRGFLLNNELTDFQALGSDSTGRPYANSPQGGKMVRRTALGVDSLTVGGKRALSSMNPLIVVEESTGRPVLGLGSPGGTRIPGQNLNVLLNVLNFDTPLQEATDTARCVSRNNGAEVEDGIFQNVQSVQELRSRGFRISRIGSLGNVQSVLLHYTDSGELEMCGAADTARNAVALAQGI